MAKDATGLDLVGRTESGRYLYRVLGTGWHYHTIPLSHGQRVVFARLRLVVDQVCPGTQLYPFRSRGCAGRGAYGRKIMWLPVDADLSEATARVIAHELVHNVDALHHGSRGNYAPRWVEREAHWTAIVRRVTSDFKVWPEVKGLRHTLAPQQKKARAEHRKTAALKSETPLDRWTKKHAHAARMLAQWERRQRMASSKVKRWSRAARMAERKISEVQS